MSTLMLLGPQRHQITIAEALESLDEGPCAVITAGWQERELEMAELEGIGNRKTINLQLHHRAETIFKDDPDFREEHRTNQRRIKHLQEIYRIRLNHTLGAVHDLMARAKDFPADVLEHELEDAMVGVRALDQHHLNHMRDIHEDFQEKWRVSSRPHARDHHYELTETLESCTAVLIAGGHVAVLLNRLRLLDLEPFIREKPVLAWSAGAMVLGERVVLFHDSPPQGPGYAEVFEAGLGLFDNVIPLPHANNRLQLDNPTRVSLFARRFNHASCLTLETGSRVDRVDGKWIPKNNIHCLREDGVVEPWEGP